jgi:hypothetical protein
MSDAVFESQDSQADWTALGDRMRRVRMWLLLMLVSLGLYLGAQSWARMRRDGAELSLFSLSGPASAPLTAALASDGRQPPDHAASQEAKHFDNVANQGPKSPESIKPRPAPAPAPAPAPSPKGPTGQHVRPPSSKGGGSGPLRMTTHAGSVAHSRDSGQPSHKSPPQADQLEVIGRSIGEWIVQWERQRQDALEKGSDIAALALAEYARRSSRARGKSSAAPPADQPTDADGPPAPYGTAENVPADDGPALAGPRPSGLSIQNPQGSGGAVHYLINGQDHTLEPGQSQELPLGQWLIEFHRGGDHGDMACTLAGGSYRFEITGSGWELVKRE